MLHGVRLRGDDVAERGSASGGQADARLAARRGRAPERDCRSEGVPLEHLSEGHRVVKEIGTGGTAERSPQRASSILTS